MAYSDTSTDKTRFTRFNIIILILCAATFVFLMVKSFFLDDAYVMVNDERLHVLVAQTDRQKRKGLGNREDLGEYDGMVFLYSGSFRIGIWMKGMEFPIDIIWLNNGKIVDIAPNVPVEQVPDAQLRHYYPREDANMVLEVPAGYAQQKGFKIGDQLKTVK